VGLEISFDNPVDLLPTDAITVEMTDSGESVRYNCVVVSRDRANGSDTFRCRILSRTRPTTPAFDRRLGVRWSCDEDFQPTGVAAHPTASNEFIYFRIVDASASGFGLLTSLRNKGIDRGSRIQAILSFPMVGHTAATLLVKSVRIASFRDKDYLALGVSTVG